VWRNTQDVDNANKSSLLSSLPNPPRGKRGACNGPKLSDPETKVKDGKHGGPRALEIGTRVETLNPSGFPTAPPCGGL